MDKEQFDYVVKRADTLVSSNASTQVTKDAAQAWKDAAATAQLLDILEGRPTTIDGVIAFAEGPAREMFGEEAAAHLLARQQQRKEQGAKFCDCDACTTASEILAEFGRVEL